MATEYEEEGRDGGADDADAEEEVVRCEEGEQVQGLCREIWVGCCYYWVVRMMRMMNWWWVIRLYRCNGV
jgi:hypothetical protein